jgi:hypothetical protein
MPSGIGKSIFEKSEHQTFHAGEKVKDYQQANLSFCVPINAQHGRWAFKTGKFYSSLYLAAAFLLFPGAGLAYILIYAFPPPL